MATTEASIWQYKECILCYLHSDEEYEFKEYAPLTPDFECTVCEWLKPLKYATHAKHNRNTMKPSLVQMKHVT